MEIEANWQQAEVQLHSPHRSPRLRTQLHIKLLAKKRQSAHQCSTSRWGMHPKVHHFHMTPHSIANDALLNPKHKTTART